jgi:hypothetical protein
MRQTVDWTELSLWVERLPWWQQLLVLPPLLPWVLVATLCRISPRRAAVVAVPLIAASILSLGSGLGAEAAYRALGLVTSIYACYTVMCFSGVSWLLLQEAGERRSGAGKPMSRANGSSLMWDREIDG